MAQYIYLQDDTLGDNNNVRMLNTPQQVLNTDQRNNVYVYHQAPQANSIPAGHFQPQQQAAPQQQWVQTGIQGGQVIYSPQVQQQQTVVSQAPMNVIVQPANMINAQRQVNQPTYMKMVTVNSPQHHQQLMNQQQQQQQQQQTVMIPRVSAPVNARPQMMPVILNTGYRPQMTSQPQSVIIQNTNPPPLRPANVQQSSPGMIQQQHTQQVIIDPRTFMQVQQTGQQNQIQVQQPPQQQQQGVVMNTPRTTVQYRLVQAKPQGTVAQGTTSTVTTQNSTLRFTRPQQQQQQQQGQQRPMLLNGPRMGVPRIIRPQVRMVRTAGGLQAVRVVRPIGGGNGQQKTRQMAPQTSAALTTVLTAKLSQAKLQQGIKTAPGSIQQTVVRKASPMATPPRPYSPVVNTPRANTPTQVRSPAPPPQSWSPMVEVRQPHSGGGDSKSDDDIENSLSTAILHRQPQDMMNSPGQSQPQQQQQQLVQQSHRGPPGSVDISAVMHTDVINTQNSCDTARMLVVLPDEERRLITFTLPSESCTVNELLEQVGIELTPNMQVRCVAIADEGLDYVVTIKEEKPALMPQSTQVQVHVGVLASGGMHQQQYHHSQPQTPQPQLQQHVQTPSPLHQTPSQLHQKKPAPVPAPVVPAHVPKYVEGFLAICDFCGFLSLDHAKCERCSRMLATPQRKPTKPPPKPVTTDQVLTEVTPKLTPKVGATASLVRMATPVTDKIKRPSPAVRAPSVRGRGSRVTPGSGRGGRGGAARGRKVEEPVVLTLSSDEEDEGANGDSKTPKRYAFEPEYPDEGGSGDTNATDIPDADRIEVCSQTGQPGSLNTSLECKELRFGSYMVPIAQTSTVAITHLGMKFIVPHVQDKSRVQLNLQSREIMKFIVHYEKNLPVIFLYTTPGCGRYIRRALGMGPVLGPQKGSDPLPAFYDPTNCLEQVKRIVIVAKVLRDDSKQTIKMVFPRLMYDEITYRDALELLQKSRGSTDAETPTAPRRSSAIAAMATIKKFAHAEITPVKGSALDSSSQQPSDSLDIHKLMIYPPQGKGGISINTEDYQCLAVDQYLNDVIIDFYLKYLHQEIMSPEQRDRTHIFSSFFYKRLTATSARQRHIERELKMTAAQKRHNRVKSWTKNVDLFDKDFIVIPINELSHWFLAVICFPGMDKPRSARTGLEMPAGVPGVSKVSVKVPQLTKQAVKDMEKRKSGLMSVTIGNTTITPVGKREENIYVNEETLSERDEAEGDESDMMTEDEEEEEAAVKVTLSQEQLKEPVKQPCILVFDSLRGTARSRVTATLREYLTCEYAARKSAESAEKVFDKNTMPGHNAKVPQQNNFTDCGLFVLQYVEEMIRNPIGDFKLPMKELKTWFNTQKVTRKREDIAVLIRSLLSKQHEDRVQLLPEIDFPTVNGEPVEPEKPQPDPLTPPVKPEPMRSGDAEEDEEADSEDLFAEIENTVVDENEADMEEESNVSMNSEKKVTKLMIPSLNKRKSSLDANGASPGSSENSSARKAARIS